MGQPLPKEYLVGQPHRKYFFVFLLSNLPPPAPPVSRTLEFKVTKLQLPPNRKVWHTLFVLYFFHYIPL